MNLFHLRRTPIALCLARHSEGDAIWVRFENRTVCQGQRLKKQKNPKKQKGNKGVSVWRCTNPVSHPGSKSKSQSLHLAQVNGCVLCSPFAAHPPLPPSAGARLNHQPPPQLGLLWYIIKQSEGCRRSPVPPAATAMHDDDNRAGGE